MTPNPAAARVRKAQVELAAAELDLLKSTRPWRRSVHRHRGALVAIGGFASGLALALLPARWWARFGAVAGAAAAGVARSALTPALVGAVLARRRNEPEVAIPPTIQ